MTNLAHQVAVILSLNTIVRDDDGQIMHMQPLFEITLFLYLLWSAGKKVQQFMWSLRLYGMSAQDRFSLFIRQFEVIGRVVYWQLAQCGPRLAVGPYGAG